MKQRRLDAAVLDGAKRYLRRSAWSAEVAVWARQPRVVSVGPLGDGFTGPGPVLARLARRVSIALAAIIRGCRDTICCIKWFPPCPGHYSDALGAGIPPGQE